LQIHPLTLPPCLALGAWRAGDAKAKDQLFAWAYPHLKKRAIAILHSQVEQARRPLSATELLHESFFRIELQRCGYSNRVHFLSLCTQILRRVLVDALREQAAEKRGGHEKPLSLFDLNAEQLVDSQSPLLLVELLDTLEKLELRDQRAARVLELRLLGGLSAEETAEALDIGVATVVRDFAFARAFLSAD
jgi:RNA polymerase sigma factor (TIGR02999 family)